MKWTVLSDNRSCDSQLQTEHGLSVLSETKGHRILLDTGASDVFIRNAEKMGIDLSTVDYVFISHGHSDPAGGLQHFLRINERAKVIVSPHAISGKFFSKRWNLHSITTEWPALYRLRPQRFGKYPGCLSFSCKDCCRWLPPAGWHGIGRRTDSFRQKAYKLYKNKIE